MKYSESGEQPIAEISAIRQHIESLRKQTENVSRTKALTELSVQVAHDIRSPLAALDMVVKESAVLPESDRVLVRTAVSRNLCSRSTAESRINSGLCRIALFGIAYRRFSKPGC